MSPSGFSLILSFSLLGVLPVASLHAAEVLKLPPEEHSALVRRVGAFWNAWKKRNYEKAVEFVVVADRESFRRARKFPVKSWTIKKITCRNGVDRAVVEVLVQRYEPIMGRYFEWRHSGNWVKSKFGWLMTFSKGSTKK